MAQDTTFPPTNTVPPTPAVDPAVVPQAPVSIHPSGEAPVAVPPVSAQVSPQITPPPTAAPMPTANTPGTVVHDHEIHVEGDVQSVPQEGIGLAAEMPSTVVVETPLEQPPMDVDSTPVVPAEQPLPVAADSIPPAPVLHRHTAVSG